MVKFFKNVTVHASNQGIDNVEFRYGASNERIVFHCFSKESYKSITNTIKSKTNRTKK